MTIRTGYPAGMTPRNEPSLNESLSDVEYERLAAILRSFPGKASMDLEEMDGFFAALICGPVTVPPSKYLHEIWGGGSAPFATEAEFRDFLNLAIRHWNFVARVLGDPDLLFLPLVFADEGDAIPRGNLWAKGFLRGTELCREAWDEIFQDEEKFSLLVPVLALAHEHDPDPTMRTWENPPGPELRKEVIAGISLMVQRLFDHFRSRAASPPASEKTTYRKSGRRLGRNDPCYCGSGKKYKRCCGNVTVH